MVWGAVQTEFISKFFEEISPTLLPVPGVDTKTYQKKLVERFGKFGVTVMYHTVQRVERLLMMTPTAGTIAVEHSFGSMKGGGTHWG